MLSKASGANKLTLAISVNANRIFRLFGDDSIIVSPQCIAPKKLMMLAPYAKRLNKSVCWWGPDVSMERLDSPTNGIKPVNPRSRAVRDGLLMLFDIY